MWPPVTVATPHGTGSGLTAGEEDLQKWSPFLSTEAPGLSIFSLFALSASTVGPYECGLHLILQLHVIDLMGLTRHLQLPQT